MPDRVDRRTRYGQSYRTTSCYNRRLPVRFKTTLWLIWVAVAMLLTAGIVRWHIEYFRSPGPQFYRAVLIGFPLLAAGTLIWTYLRTRFLWRYELAAIVAIPLIAALLREPRATFIVAALFASCYCGGRALCDGFGWATDAPATADVVFSVAAGFGLINTALFVSGIAGLWYPWFFALLLLLPILVFPRNLLRLVRMVRALFRRWGELDDLRRPAGIMIPFAAMLACLYHRAPAGTGRSPGTR